MHARVEEDCLLQEMGERRFRENKKVMETQEQGKASDRTSSGQRQEWTGDSIEGEIEKSEKKNMSVYERMEQKCLSFFSVSVEETGNLFFAGLEFLSPADTFFSYFSPSFFHWTSRTRLSTMLSTSI